MVEVQKLRTPATFSRLRMRLSAGLGLGVVNVHKLNFATSEVARVCVEKDLRSATCTEQLVQSTFQRTLPQSTCAKQLARLNEQTRERALVQENLAREIKINMCLQCPWCTPYRARKPGPHLTSCSALDICYGVVYGLGPPSPHIKLAP